MKGIKASRNGHSISHLLFVDDSILFGEASLQGVRVLKNILKEYELQSGQCVNFEKSMVFFSKNTLDSVRTSIAKELGVRCSSNSERYLGLSNMIGNNRRASF